MKEGFSLSVKGLREVRDALKKLPGECQRRVYRNAVRQSGAAIKEQIRMLAPVRTGTLRDSIKVTVTQNRDTPGFTAWVSSSVFYAHMLEGGTLPHEIKARKRRMFIPGIGVRTVIKHPGITARNFIATGLERGRGPALRRLETALDAGLAREIKRLERGK